MKTTRLLRPTAWAAAGLLGWSTQAATLQVTVENLAPAGGTLLTPVWVGFHNGSFDLFSAGQPASPALESLAEDGNNAPLNALFMGAGSGTVYGTIASGGAVPPLEPGEKAVMTFTVDESAASSRFLSYAAMIIPSNDAFIGNDQPTALRVFDNHGNFIGGSRVITGNMVWDAGTEMNDELPANTAFLGQASPNTGTSEGGGVELHPGFKAAGMSGVLDGAFAGFTFAQADFKVSGYQVARITVTKLEPVIVAVENLGPARGALLTPTWVGFHDGAFVTFASGEAANPALERLAEDGTTTPLSAAFHASGHGSQDGVLVSGGAVPPLEPGEHVSKEFLLDPHSPLNRYLSYASMIIPSNDAFIGNRSPTALPVFDETGRFVGGTFLILGNQVWDAGTEVNDEAPVNTAFLGQATPDTGTAEGAVVHPHPGFNPAGAGGILDGAFAGFTFAQADFKAAGYQVARVTITRPVPVTVTIENLAPAQGTLTTPTWLGFHDGQFDAFNAGTAASPGLERLAEDGDPAMLQSEFAASGHGGAEAILASGGAVPPLEPGERSSLRFQLDPTSPKNRYLSYASMVIPSNDAFIGNENPMALPVFDARGNFIGGSRVITGEMIWDAGTEVNDEVAANTAFLGQAAPNTGAPEGGVVHPHPGFKAAGMGGILDGTFAGFTFSAADFKAPGYRVMRVSVSARVMVTLIAENMAPAGGSYLTPVWAGFHDGTFDSFTSGQAAGAGVENVAEDGTTSVLAAEFLAQGGGQVEATTLSNGPIPPLAPGQRAVRTFALDPQSPSSRYFSYASMVIPSNDAFIGNDNPKGLPVFDLEGTFLGVSRTVNGSMVWDAGTEVNDELPANTAFLGQATPNTGMSEGGVVHSHPGFRAKGQGGILDVPMFAAADFTAPGYQVAQLTLTLAPFITGIAREGDGIRVTWTGGKPPFAIEIRERINDGAWMEVGTTSERTMVLPAGAAAGFLRLRAAMP